MVTEISLLVAESKTCWILLPSMGASSASTRSNTNINTNTTTISVTHEFRIGRFVCGCFSGSIHSPYSFSLLLLLSFLLWASLSSFLVASEEGVVVPTSISNTSSASSSSNSGTASVSPTPPASSLLNTSTGCDADTCTTTATSSSSSEHKQHRRVDLKIGLVVGVSLFLFLFFSVAVIMGCFPRFRFINRRRRHGPEKVVAHEYDDQEGGNRDRYCKDHAENDCSRPGKLGTHDVCRRPGRRFTWAEVEKFTSNFSSVIGSGGFSTVYLAQFPNSALGAIKIHSSSERLNRVFKQEMEILMGLEHDNIVKFLGYCDEREEGVLVFEYVPGGNLQEKLHNHKREWGSSKAAAAVLPWKSRMTIAYQLAQAIEYLHEKCPLQIVHGDIKSSNILLDEQLNCKLCDFGSAKMGFSSTVLPPSSTRANRMMMGSPGYTDPHYLRTGIASKKNDVYSFGVILLELITGKEALSSQNGERLTSIAGPLLEDESKVTEMLMDARLKLLDGAAGVDLEEVKTMAAIAAMCLSDSTTLRPSASDIVRIMSCQISAFLPSAAVDK